MRGAVLSIVVLSGIVGLGALAVNRVLPAPAAREGILLSGGQPAIASSAGSYGTGPENAVDGLASTEWTSGDGDTPQWIQVDLGAVRAIRRVVVSWHAPARAYQIQVSLDATAWTTVHRTTDGDGGTDDIALSVVGRYVRLYAPVPTPASEFSLWELAVYGDVVGDPPPTAGSGSPSADPATAFATSSPSPAAVPRPASDGTAVPFGSHQREYVAGTLRPTGDQSALDAAVVAYYREWKAAFVRHNCGSYQVISPDADHPLVAEAQGYGMVITALMAGADPDAKTVFDGIVAYVQAHPSRNNPRLLAAEQDEECRSVNGTDSATDGDMDVAYGLLLADRQWGSRGRYDYRTLAVAHIDAIVSSEVDPSTHLLTLGDWSRAGGWAEGVSRSSDWIVDHMRAFRRATGDPVWDTIRQAHQRLIATMQARYAPQTGLLPDFVIDTGVSPAPADGRVLESGSDGDYYWNACRVPWRIGTDAVTSGDATSLAAARALNRWVRAATGGDPGQLRVGYTLDGEELGSGNSAAFLAPFAVAATTDPDSQAWLDSLWQRMLTTGVTPTGYYSASLQLQAMIVITGNYWVP